MDLSGLGEEAPASPNAYGVRYSTAAPEQGGEAEKQRRPKAEEEAVSAGAAKTAEALQWNAQATAEGWASLSVCLSLCPSSSSHALSRYGSA